jgi:hypothetical protein
MSGNPFYQDLDPMSVPDQVTPQAAPSSPANYAGVTPHGAGPAPYDLQAPSPEGEVTAAFDQSIAVGGAGVLYPMSPRIAAAKAMMESPQGYGSAGIDVVGGYHGGGGQMWPGNVEFPHDGP